MCGCACVRLCECIGNTHVTITLLLPLSFYRQLLQATVCVCVNDNSSALECSATCVGQQQQQQKLR